MSIMVGKKCCSSGGRGSLSSSTLAVVAMSLAAGASSSRKPDGLVVVSRHGVRQQFPSNVHNFEMYAPGKTFATSDEVRLLAVFALVEARRKKFDRIFTSKLLDPADATCPRFSCAAVG